MKYDVIHDLLMQKFDPVTNSENAVLLAAISTKYLEETNWWGDTYWGVGVRAGGQNRLGELLMRVRELRSTVHTK